MLERTNRVVAHAAVLLVVLAAACKEGPDAATPSGDPRPAKAGTCPASSVASGNGCPTRVIPPGDGSSPEDCKSDADCKDGRDGRCVKTSYGGHGGPSGKNELARAGNLLAGPPAAPHRSTCAYDLCMTDADCGPKSRCVCGSGVGASRNGCVGTDACVSDRDCSADMLCTCGAANNPNYCNAGNCRTDADCGHGSSCIGPEYGGGRFCTTSRDTCKKDEDCKKNQQPGDGYSTCSYVSEQHAWGCRLVPPVPPG